MAQVVAEEVGGVAVQVSMVPHRSLLARLSGLVPATIHIITIDVDHLTKESDPSTIDVVHLTKENDPSSRPSKLARVSI